ncbi:Gam-like protein [Leptospira borgpetersenii serovar Pomona str. 200901868]|uniref:Gam-like protein n=1 Tax=Leptospira borgpetersenii serovar Pomona str. 200901868 TaxID=1192866 RepID=M6WGE3_LEPBO|nr:Gam-like protein [Leptospira borgpetersenii serovar Pomona str. 200901868]
MTTKTKSKNLVDLPDNNYLTRDDLTQAVAQLGEFKRQRDRITSKTDDQISKLQNDLQEEISPLDVKI